MKVAAMLKVLAAAVLLGAPASRVCAYEVVGQISGTPQMAVDYLNARVVLNDGLYSAFATSSGHFKIEDVPAGVYHLDIYEPKLKFRKYKVDVSSRNGGTIRALSKPFPGGEKKLESYPLMVQPIAPEVYFRVRAGTNPIAMVFRNPIFLIMGVFAVLKLFAGNLTPPAEGEEGNKDGDGAPSGVHVAGQVADDDDDDADDDDMPPLNVEETKAPGRAPVRRKNRRGKHD